MSSILTILIYIYVFHTQLHVSVSLSDAVDSKAAYEKREKRRNIRKLQEAIDSKDIAAVQDLLKRDFDVDFRYRGQTALQLAVRLGALDICKLLVERGANVDEADGELNSLLNTACWNGYEDIAKLLIDNNANLDSENDAGSTSLHACAKKGHARIARLLVAGNCSLNIPDRLGRTAVLVAAEAGNSEVVAELVRAGADLDWVEQHLKTPLMVAADQGFVDIARSLIDGGMMHAMIKNNTMRCLISKFIPGPWTWSF